MSFKYLLHFAVLCIELTSSIAQKIKVHTVDVEDFLKKVIFSQRFDEIADKIADKAVEKIKRMKNFEMSPVARSKVDGGAAYRVSDYENKEKSKVADVKHNNEPEITEDITTAKAFNEMLIKKDALSPIEGLSLKFRQFTKKYDTTIETNPVKEEEKDISKNNIAYEERIKSIELKTAVESEEKPDIFENSSHVTIQENNKEKLQTGYEVESSIEVPLSHENIVPVSQKPVLRSQKNYPITIEEADSIDPKGNEENIELKSATLSKRRPYDEYSKPGKPIELRNSPSLGVDETASSGEDSYAEDEAANAALRKRKHILASESKTPEMRSLVRKEGDKLYTYEKSPDYADYNEQVVQSQNKMEKQY